VLRALKLGAALALACSLAACSSFDFGWLGNSSPPPPTSPPPAPAASFTILPADPLVGRWGLASFRDPKDRARTEKMAQVQCKNAYVIAKGPTDGVMMHVADDPDMHELALKKGADGKTYLGFNAPPGDPADREVVEMTPKLLVMRFVDPDANSRYGTFVYVRCPPGKPPAK
jgi:hypothetical protein